MFGSIDKQQWGVRSLAVSSWGVAVLTACFSSIDLLQVLFALGWLGIFLCEGRYEGLWAWAQCCTKGVA